MPWICGEPGIPLIVVLPTLQEAQTFCSDRESLFRSSRTLFLKPVPLDKDSIHDPAFSLERGETLSIWKAQKSGILVATPGSLLGPLKKSDSFFTITKGQIVHRDELVRWLTQNGFTRSDLVWSPGQFASRGFIFDIFNPGRSLPLRIEFSDEEVESIRVFQPNSQRSVGSMESMKLQGIKHARGLTLNDIIEPDHRILLFDPERIETQAETYIWLWNNLAEDAEDKISFSWHNFYLSLSNLQKLRIHNADTKTTRWRIPVEHCPPFRGNMDSLLSAIHQWQEDQFSIYLFTDNPVMQERLSNSPVNICSGSLSNGFIDLQDKRIVISDLEVSGVSNSWYSQRDFNPIPSDWQEGIQVGEYVIHREHGVALFQGLEKVSLDEHEHEMLVLEFAEGKRLLFPIFNFSKISSLSVIPGEEPELDVLGGKRWKNRLQKDRASAREDARAIINIFAHREMLEGYGFNEDSSMLGDFEKAFPFIETSDQLSAIESVKKDMENTIPMDRLLVGDVGYGKTEVALRAAFKAVDSGKQVAFLVPTTVLAQQHFQTFSVRFAGFPINIAYLSRFQKPREQKDILQRLREGQIDIIIGTSRIIQKDVTFRDLGLLIIDEEHRFGVVHKEKLKKEYSLVDVLTLSATPIPRTLSLSLQGLRPISILATPPENRIPVTTYVGPWNDHLVLEAVSRELTRGGQIFFVHNRVKTIYQRVETLRQMFPQATIADAHGQMNNKELEKHMLDFYAGTIDILVCTTIIESGLDVGRANTLIVDDSHEMGLAQLYQLRGRIGRRSQAAFAFFLYPRESVIGEESRERLEAMASLPGMGGGYNLALHDLKIRGGGELLGTMQHGHRSGVALDHYYHLLQEEIRKIRGEILKEPEIIVELESNIPASFIPQDNVRIVLYRKILRLASLKEMENLVQEIRDRFGTPPLSFRSFLDITRIRILSRETGLYNIRVSREEIRIEGPDEMIQDLFRGRSSWLTSSGYSVGPGGQKGLQYLISILKDRAESSTTFVS